MSYASLLEIYMLELVNEERTSRGLGALELEVNLNSAAEDHSDWMLDNNIFSHTGVDDSSASTRIREAGFDLSGSWGTAENIAVQTSRGAAGFRDDVADLHASLMDSPGHRANILKTDMKYIGIGIEVGEYTYSSGLTAESVMVTQNFGRTSGTVDLDDLLQGESQEEDTEPEQVVGTTFTGTQTADSFTGTDDMDNISGMEGGDTLHGGGSNDSLSGGTGADRLFGDAGHDTMDGDSATDVLRGGDGRDTMTGGTGADTLYGDAGNDSLLGNTGVDLIYGGGGDDWISSGNGVDVVYGEAGDDYIIGRTGWDSLYGGDGEDSLYGSEGRDRLDGGNDSDFLSGGSGEDRVNGGGGNDEVYGNRGADNVLGGSGNDSLFGATGDDTLEGGSGNDVLYGSQGVDVLEGGVGNDTLHGGTQADTFVFAAGHGADVISAFEADSDVLQLDSDLVGSATTGADVMATYGSTRGDGFFLDFGGGNTIEITEYLRTGAFEDDISII